MRVIPATTSLTAWAPSCAFSTDWLANVEISPRLRATSSMDSCTSAIEVVPCLTAETCVCACPLTWSMLEDSSSTEAEVSSSVEAWLCAPSARFFALSDICWLADATCWEFC